MNPFSGVAGQERVLSMLETQLAADRLSHAYLFIGEPGTGKSLVARRLAAALLPEAPLERHPDYWEDDGRHNLSINEVRLLPDRPPELHDQSLQAFLALKPALGSRRIALITNVGRLKDEVQAILLKTLEEPHPARILILTSPSASPFVVLPTVVSRCQRIDFRPLPEETIESLLREHGLNEPQAQQIAALSRGRPGWALRAAGEPVLLDEYRNWTTRLQPVLEGGTADALNLAAELDAAQLSWRSGDRKREDPVLVALTSWQLALRERMLAAPQPRLWAGLLERSFDTLGYLEQNVSPRLALECFLLECARLPLPLSA